MAAQYADTAGVPAFFAHETFPLLTVLKSEHGYKAVTLDHIADTLLVDCPEAARDIDTPEDYALAQQKLAVEEGIKTRVILPAKTVTLNWIFTMRLIFRPKFTFAQRIY